MEFTYRISEADYLAAAKLRRGAVRTKSVGKTVVFWVFILICLMVLWAVIQRSKNQSTTSSPVPAQTASDSSDSASAPRRANPANVSLYNFGPFVLIVAIWGFLLYQQGPSRIRKLYRRDPQMQGEILVKITPESFWSSNSAGSTSQQGWNIYKRWIESGNLILLVMRSQSYVILNVAGLSEMQRAELRSILSTALPRK